MPRRRPRGREALRADRVRLARLVSSRAGSSGAFFGLVALSVLVPGVLGPRGPALPVGPRGPWSPGSSLFCFAWLPLACPGLLVRARGRFLAEAGWSSSLEALLSRFAVSEKKKRTPGPFKGPRSPQCCCGTAGIARRSLLSLKAQYRPENPWPECFQGPRLTWLHFGRKCEIF